MNLPVLTLQNEKIVSLCAVCVSDRNGGQIALLIIVSTLMAISVGLIFGLWPANRASKLRPIEALRHE